MSGSELLVGLVQSAPAGHRRCTGFLSRTSAAWERETASRATELLDKAAQLERSLSSKATAKAVEELAHTIRTWAKLTAPQRALDLATVLRHEGSVAPVSRWRELAIDMANEQGAAREALIIIKELAEAFESLPDLGGRLREDLKACQDMVLAVREHEVIMQLEAVIAEADKERETLSQSLDGNEPTSSAPAIVTRLRDALVEAVQNASGERPWLVWRAFTLRLHNQFQLTAAALSLMRVAIAVAHLPAAKGRIPGSLAARLEADVRVLLRELTSRKLAEAIEANRTGDAIQLIDELISPEPNAAQREKWQKTRQELERRLQKRRLKAGFWIGSVAAFFIWGALQAPGSSSPPVPVPAPPVAPRGINVGEIKGRSQVYLDGRADRQVWENWFATLSGYYRNGAEYWAGVRNNPKPGSCYGAAGQNLGDWTAGCLAAQQKLKPSDRRRRTERDYRAGWNSL